MFLVAMVFDILSVFVLNIFKPPFWGFDPVKGVNPINTVIRPSPSPLPILHSSLSISSPSLLTIRKKY